MTQVTRLAASARVWALLVSAFALAVAAGCSGDSPGVGADNDGGGGSGGGGGGPRVVVDAGDPITAPPRVWTAVPVEGTLCRNNQATGFGVSINPDSRKLVIYLEGGGACFNAITCGMNPTAWAPTDATLNTSVGRIWLLNRASANSPFKDWNMAYVPYCTGDVHSGAAMAGFMGQPQVGHLNYVKYLARMIATFRNLEQVVFTGSSAGGFGVAWNWMVTQDAFGTVPVYVINDSGPPLGPDYLAQCQQNRVGTLWGWDQTIHPACTSCDLATGKVVWPMMEASLKRNATVRMGLLSYDEDSTIKSFFGFGLNDCAGWNMLLPPAYPAGKYGMGLAELRQVWAGYPQAAMYVVAGASHTFLGTDLSMQKTGDITMLDWVTKLVDKADGWTNVSP